MIARIMKLAFAATVVAGISMIVSADASAQEKPMFSKMDKNGDGTATIEERKEFSKTRFAERDKNADGKISAEEDAIYLVEIFKAMDANNDEVVVIEELLLHTVEKPVDTKNVKNTPADAKTPDLNNDGKVEMDEFIAFRVMVFKTADANKDGKLTADEFSALRDARRKDIDADKDGMVTLEENVTYWIGNDPKEKK
jgi:Ca2+-binding EF-hand superfamily protein